MINVDSFVKREEVKRFGALYFHKLQWRSMWAFISINLTSYGEQKKDPPQGSQVKGKLPYCLFKNI